MQGHIALVALLALPAAAQAQGLPPVQTYDPDANVASQTDHAPRGSSADRRGSIEGLRVRSQAINADVSAVTTAAQHNWMLRELGQLAQKRAQEPRIRQLGTVVQEDAEEANEALRDLATRMQLTFPKGPSPDQQARLEELSNLAPNGTFERELVDTMLSEQETGLQLLVSVQRRTQEPKLKGLLTRAARSLREAQRATAIERQPMKD